MMTFIKQLMLNEMISVAVHSFEWRRSQLATRFNSTNNKNFCFRPLIIGLEYNYNNQTVLNKIRQLNLCQTPLKWIYIPSSSSEIDFDHNIIKINSIQQICENFLLLKYQNSNRILIEESITNNTNPLYWQSSNNNQYGFSRNFSYNSYAVSIGGWFIKITNVSDMEHNLTPFILWLKQKINIVSITMKLTHNQEELEYDIIHEITDVEIASQEFDEPVNNSVTSFPDHVADWRIYLATVPSIKVDWRVFFCPFTFDVWYIVGLMLLSMSIFWTLIYRKLKIGNLNFITSYTVWGCFLNKGISEFPKVPSQKILLITLTLTFYLFWNLYNALLYSFFSVQLTDKPFKHKVPFERDNRYKIGAGPYDYKNILRQFPHLKHRIEPFQLNETIQIFERMCREKFGVFTYLSGRFFEKGLNTVGCEYYQLGMGFRTFTGYSVRKNSPIRDLINQYILASDQYGKFLLIQPYTRKYIKNPLMEITIELVAPVFTMLTIMATISLFILIFEIIHHHIQRKRTI